MNLAKIAVNLRPRNPWEGIDLGFMLARQWFLPLWILWMISALPMMVLLTLLPLPLWLAGMLIWWFKPLYEPPLLYWLGRRLFGERLSWREFRATWLRAVLPQLFSNLTWRRLHPARSFLMPVSVLERLKGKARSQRVQVLSRKSNAASWLTVIGIHFEFIFQVGFGALLAMLIPEELLWFSWQDLLLKPDAFGAWVQQVTYLLAMSMMAPFYVAGGFALYLARRSELEGWDIELGLRRILQRHSSSVASWGGVVLLSGLVLFALPSAPTQASEIDRTEVKSLIQEVLADEVFGRYEEGHRWKYVGQDSDDGIDEDELSSGWLKRSGKDIARFLEVLLWLVGAALLAYLIYWFIANRDLLPAGFKTSRNERTVPTEIAGLDLRPESLPDDPAREAERLFEAGDYRNGLSLLYRSALSNLVHRHALEIPEGATEGECQRLVSDQLGEQLDGCFSHLTLVWLRQAYAHLSPEREQALILCREWRNCFGGSEINA
jgi:hypothetical protein